MARHRNVRSLRYADEYEGYDDVYGHSLEDESCLSPGEAAQWMYDRARPTLASYYEEDEESKEESKEEPEVDRAKPPLELDDAQQAKLAACLDEVRDVLGDTLPDDLVGETIVRCDYDVAAALDALLDVGKAKRPKPKTVVKSIKTPAAAPTPKLEEKPKCKSPEPTAAVEDKTPVRQKERVDPTALYSAERGSAKEHLYVVVVGHVDAGKSTLLGRLLCDLGEVNQRTLHKYEQESKKVGKQSFAYAWVFDETGEERTRGITMDVGRMQFSTESKHITVLDAPGHADFIPNMIAGAGQADAAVLVVDATVGEFESGFDLGGQTREHALLVRSLGISQLAVAVNKLDTTDWSKQRFDEICAKLKSFLKQAGFKESDITYIPLSGLTGQNLVSAPTDSKVASWYNGPCLIQVIDKFKSPERPITKHFRMSVNDIFKGTGSGFCIFGKIETGVLHCGDKVLVCPTKESATVKSILINDSPHNVAFAGDQVSVTLLGIDIQNVAVGYIICDALKPIPVASVFEARIVVFNIKVPITKGYPILIHHQSLIESANIVKLKASINKSTGEVIKKKPRCLGNQSVALVDIEVSRPICMEVYKDFKELGRIMLRVSGVTIAAGLVTAIIK